MLILGVESSCDETAAAVLDNGKIVLSNIINSQIDLHSKYGGVVPELASRKHVENIFPVVSEALDQAGKTLDDIDCFAVTTGPGLIGSLLVGLSFVKALSYARKIPYIAVDHLSGHINSIFLGVEQPTYPYIATIASGGHSSIFLVKSPTDYQLLGRSRDDAAGEAFDKVAKMLSLDYPGGPIIGKLAREGNRDAISFPRAWLSQDSLDFSFSGVKTAVANYVNTFSRKDQQINIPDVCASFQEAVVEVLVEKSIRAARQHGIKQIVVGGGVAANQRLREFLAERGSKESIDTFTTPLQYCTDNAAMIALAGYYQVSRATLAYDMDVFSRSPYLS